MKKISYIAILLVGFMQTSYAQLDTIGKYPYLYHYNWPETGVVQSDSVYCNVYLGSTEGGCYISNDRDWWNNFFASLNSARICEYAVYQHTDTPLTVIGLAVGYQLVDYFSYKKISLFDSSMTELASVHGRYCFLTFDSLYMDTNAHQFYFPGLALPVNPTAEVTDDPASYFYYEFFDKEIVVSGDFYIGYYNETHQCMSQLPAYLRELHGAPYHIASPFRLRIDSVWSPIKTSIYVPTLFAILKFPCEPVDSVSVVLGSDGCLTVDWERPELQSSWTVRLTMPDGSEILQPTDTNHWEYCGLATNQRYTVHVRSRCDDINGHSWSDWGDGFSVGHQSIAETALPTLDVHPNPTDGTVAIPVEGIREVWCVAADGRRTQLVMKNGNVSLKDHTAGLDVLEIETGEGLFAAKVIKK